MNNYESFIDGVVEYHQFRDEIGLTAAEASKHPDTLETFFALIDVVREDPSLRELHLDALRYKAGTKKDEAVLALSGLYKSIVNGLKDADVNKAPIESFDGNDAKTAEKTARVFVRLFKSQYEEVELEGVSLYKPRKSPRKEMVVETSTPTEKQIERQEAQKRILERALLKKYGVSIDNDALNINDGDSVQLSDREQKILSKLADVYTQFDHKIWVSIDSLKATLDKEDSYAKTMSGLKQKLARNGIRDLLDVDGHGKAATYRLNKNHFAPTDRTVTRQIRVEAAEELTDMQQFIDSLDETKANAFFKIVGIFASATANAWSVPVPEKSLVPDSLDETEQNMRKVVLTELVDLGLLRVGVSTKRIQNPYILDSEEVAETFTDLLDFINNASKQ